MGGEDELEKLQKAIKKEEAKVKRCEAAGIRHKNKLQPMVEKYTRLAQRLGRL